MAEQNYAVYIEGLSEAIQDISEMPERVRRAALFAVNYATKKARTQSSRAMREQIAWSASYLDEKKLSIKLATGETLEGVVGAQFRPTSLAQFAQGSKKPWTKPMSLHVSAASYRPTNGKMLFVPLRAGNGPITEDNRNIGLAVRLSDGDAVRGKYKMKPFSKGLYLLYGPSAAQVFYTVAEDIVPDVADWLDTEFARQLNRKDL